MRLTSAEHMSTPAGPARVKLSEVMRALSYALDLVEGQPEGHAVRSCMIGMRLGREIGLIEENLADLFYALLLKDSGCSSNAAKMCFLFHADDIATKGAIKTVNWTSLVDSMKFAVSHVAPGTAWWTKAMRLFGFAVAGQRAGKELIQIRCERGADIARLFGLPENTANAIYALDEHWDGAGHPNGLIGENIPLLARLLSVAQTTEVFLRQYGREAVRDMVRERSGTWFDPELARAMLAIPDDDLLWTHLQYPADHLDRYEPEGYELPADEFRLDAIALGFAQIIDAKSPWTFSHSKGVAEIATGVAGVMGMSMAQMRDVRRAALLHDIGKLGVSNLILDKPGKLTPDELVVMRRHAEFTYDILKRVPGFDRLAEPSAAHHERLDGKGYFRGIAGHQLSPMVRILAVSDMYEALAAKRPYRQDLTGEQVMSILHKNAGDGICPEVLDALKTFLNQSGFTPIQIAA